MSYTTVELVKLYANVTGATDDALISQLVDRAQKAIDNHTGRTFEANADSTRRYTVGVDTDDDLLFLDKDLCQITSIITDADAASPVTLVSTEYVTQPRNTTPYYAIKLLGSSSNSWTYTTNAEGGITVTGRFAYSLVAPTDIAHAATRLATYYYRQKDAGVFDTTAIPDAGIIQVPQGIPADVKIILAPYVRGS